MKKVILVLLPLVFLLVSCGDSGHKMDPITEGQTKEEEMPPPPLPPADSVASSSKLNAELAALGDEILLKIKNNDWAALQQYVDAGSKGIRFSPYEFVSPNDVQLQPKEIAANSAKKYLWGEYDGSGEAIKLTTSAYAKEFVYNKDFLKGDSIEKKTFENTNWANGFYKGVDVVSYRSSGSEKNAGMDWSSVALIFAKKNGKRVLVGIVHGQWTI